MAKTLEQRVKDLEKKVEDMEEYQSMVEELALRFGVDLRGQYKKRRDERGMYVEKSGSAKKGEEKAEKK